MVFVHAYAHSTLGGHVHTLATVCHGCTVYNSSVMDINTKSAWL